MARFLDDERAPLELTKISNKKIVVGCPNCKTARSVSVNWYGSVCKICGEYFNKETALPEDECEKFMNDKKLINKEFTKVKADMEKKAYAYKEKVMDQRSKGKLRKHEPGGDHGYWK